MSTATLPRIVSGQSDLLHNELQDELRHIRDLVFVRDLLRERGGDVDRAVGVRRSDQRGAGAVDYAAAA